MQSLLVLKIDLPVTRQCLWQRMLALGPWHCMQERVPWWCCRVASVSLRLDWQTLLYIIIYIYYRYTYAYIRIYVYIHTYSRKFLNKCDTLKQDSYPRSKLIGQGTEDFERFVLPSHSYHYTSKFNIVQPYLNLTTASRSCASDRRPAAEGWSLANWSTDEMHQAISSHQHRNHVCRLVSSWYPFPWFALPEGVGPFKPSVPSRTGQVRQSTETSSPNVSKRKIGWTIGWNKPVHQIWVWHCSETSLEAAGAAAVFALGAWVSRQRCGQRTSLRQHASACVSMRQHQRHCFIRPWRHSVRCQRKANVVELAPGGPWFAPPSSLAASCNAKYG